MKHLLTICLIVFFASFAKAGYKGVSGGNGSGGTLLDIQSYEQALEIEPQDLMMIADDGLKPIEGRFPQIITIIHHFAIEKIWFLEDRPFNPDCVDKTVVTAQHDVWACQNQVEVRVRRAYWSSATTKEKALLILHEALTALRFSHQDFESVPLIVSALTDPKMSDDGVQRRLGRLSWPNLYTAAQFNDVVPLIYDVLPGRTPLACDTAKAMDQIKRPESYYSGQLLEKTISMMIAKNICGSRDSDIGRTDMTDLFATDPLYDVMTAATDEILESSITENRNE